MGLSVEIQKFSIFYIIIILITKATIVEFILLKKSVIVIDFNSYFFL